MDKKMLDELLRRQNFYEVVNIAPHASKAWASGKYADISDTLDTAIFRNRPDLMMNTHSRSGFSTPKIKEHKHPDFELMYVYDGSITHHIGSVTVTLHKGDCLVMAPDVSHSVDECSVGDIAVNIIISTRFFTSDFMQMLSSNSLFRSFTQRFDATQKTSAPGFIYFSSGNVPAVTDTADNIMCEFFDPDISSASTIKCQLIVMFNALFRVWKNNGGKAETRNDIDNNDIWQILQYIESNYSTATLKEAAFRFGYDSYYLSRLIKKKIGQTFTEIKHRVCVEQAKAMLTGTSISVQEIAKETGFSNMSYFYLLFDKYCGMTPAEYRKMLPN